MKRLAMLTALTLLSSATGCGEGMESPAGAESQPMAVEQALYVYWTPATSEEYAPAHCTGNSLVFGAQCALSYCDNIILGCKETGPGATFGSVVWTAPFSEETTTPTLCPEGYWVTGLSCTDGYCDKVSLECTRITGRTTNTGQCQWSPNFSDENAAWRAPEGYYVRGGKCSGWWCDSLSLYYCPLL